MRLRSPAQITSILLAACALCLLGVALAAGRQTTTQRSRLIGETIDQHRLLVDRHRAQVRARRALASRRGRGARPRVAAARPATGSLALARARAMPASTTEAQGNPVGSLPGSEPATAVASLPVAVEETQPAVPTPPVTGPSPTPPAEDPPPIPPAEDPPPIPTPPSESSSAGLYWGASIGSQLTGVQAPWDMRAVSRFEQIAGKEVSLVNFFGPFANCSTSPCSFYKFPTGPMESIREHGAIPVYSWSSQSIPSSLNEPNFQLSDVIAGTYDSYIREFAEDARDWGNPFFLRFNWEMNGSWFPWSEGVNGNQPGEFVAAWRHVHDIFSAVGATNVTWVWCPNVDPDGIFHDLSSLYPGDAYVDWTGLDGYNWGLNPAKPDRWRSFDELFSATYDRIANTVAPDKPMLIGEMGSTEDGGSKANWIEEALGAIPADYPEIRGLLWFDTYDDGMDWPIETSASSANAFAGAIQSPAYIAESAVETAEGPIEPPEGPELTEALAEPLG